MTNNEQYENNRSPPEAEIFQFISGPNISNIPNMKKTFFSPSFRDNFQCGAQNNLDAIMCIVKEEKDILTDNELDQLVDLFK